MSKLGDKFRSKFGQKPAEKEARQEHRAKKMEARKEKKGQKIIDKMERGKMSKDKGNRKLKTLQRKTMNRSARIRKEKYDRGEFDKSKGRQEQRKKVYKNPITGRTRTVEKWKDSETGKKKKRVTVTQHKGSKTSQEIVRKQKDKTGDVNKNKRKIKNITNYGYDTKVVKTRAKKDGGTGGRKRKDDKRHYYRKDPTVKRRTTTIKHGRNKGKEVLAIGKKFGYEDV
jgi:hypothetical protein|tara:strand:+ start:136 stop:816 length:681 start_codon:yes stop_codon:yes gene_type:complete